MTKPDKLLVKFVADAIYKACVDEATDDEYVSDRLALLAAQAAIEAIQSYKDSDHDPVDGCECSKCLRVRRKIKASKNLENLAKKKWDMENIHRTKNWEDLDANERQEYIDKTTKTSEKL